MSLLKAPVYGLDEKFHYGKVGDIIWDGKRFYADPPKDEKLKNILRPYELATVTGKERFDPGSNPEAWIKNLYRQYVSVELRVYRANEIQPLKEKK